MLNGFIEGRIVHYVMKDGKHRPAIIVQAWNKEANDDGLANLQVFLDGKNDYNEPIDEQATGLKWVTSSHYSENKEIGTWHWIEQA